LGGLHRILIGRFFIPKRSGKNAAQIRRTKGEERMGRVNLKERACEGQRGEGKEKLRMKRSPQQKKEKNDLFCFLETYAPEKARGENEEEELMRKTSEGPLKCRAIRTRQVFWKQKAFKLNDTHRGVGGKPKAQNGKNKRRVQLVKRRPRKKKRAR